MINNSIHVNSNIKYIYIICKNKFKLTSSICLIMTLKITFKIFYAINELYKFYNCDNIIIVSEQGLKCTTLLL